MVMEWIRIDEELPKRGQAIWCYDSMFGDLIAWTVVCDPDKIDGDISHWMPRSGMSPRPPSPADGKIHAAGHKKYDER